MYCFLQCRISLSGFYRLFVNCVAGSWKQIPFNASVPFSPLIGYSLFCCVWCYWSLVTICGRVQVALLKCSICICMVLYRFSGLLATEIDDISTLWLQNFKCSAMLLILLPVNASC